MTTPLRFGLIGTGRIGQVHAANIADNPNTTLAFTADPFITGANTLAAKYGGKASENPSDVFESGEVDAVVIASPTPTHVDLITQAINFGVPVLCEKPIDLDINRVNGLRDRVAQAGVPVALGFNRRFDPAFAEVRQRVIAGEIGQLEQITIISRDPAAPPADYVQVSGGIFRDMTIHDFDMARFFLPEIVEVNAVGSTLFDEGARLHGDFDTAVTTLRSASGAIITIVNSRHSATGYDQRLEAFGTLGQLNVENAHLSLVSYSSAAATGSRSPHKSFFLDRYISAYKLELADFVDLVRGEPSTAATFEDGRAALMLADAAVASASGKGAVAVDLC